METYDLSLKVMKSPVRKSLIDPQAYGNCPSCGVLFVNVSGMKVLGLAGFYQNVLCAEQAIVERGCQWCGERKANGGYCGPLCEKNGRAHEIGDGARLDAWIERQGVKSSPRDGKCLRCGCVLGGKRSDARFCDDACKKAYQRPGKLEIGQIAGTNTPIGVGF
jgi:hypothetical protein